MFLRFLIILIVAVGVIGGSAYFAYELFWKSKALDKQEKQELEVQAALPPPPHPGIAAFNAVAETVKAGNSQASRQALEQFLVDYPDAPDVAEVRRALGELNARALFSPLPGEGKTAYTVVKGDALARIATKTKSGAELIYTVNQLDTINLQIGQVLQVPELDIKVTVDRKNKMLTVTNHGNFFREYPLLGATVPRLPEDGTLETTVSDKVATVAGKRVAFGEKTYAESERMVQLTPGGAVLRTAGADPEAPVSGIILSPGDFQQVFVLVNRGTPI
ncbi:MAG: LysM peptidoglycan-binding domain-containing protein, partial [Terrimicrobiaceae bacterium]